MFKMRIINKDYVTQYNEIKKGKLLFFVYTLGAITINRKLF